MAKPGQVLSSQEVREYQGYHNAGVSQPDKFANVVIESTDPRGQVYRHATAEDLKAAEDAAKAQTDAVAEQERLTAKIRADAAKRSVPEVPPMPTETASAEKRP
jgi:hypothetical protein